MDSCKPHSRGAVPVALIVILALLAAGAGVWYFYVRRPPQPPKPPVVTPEAKAYLPYLKISDPQMGAKESFAGQMVVEITGKISNTGDRNLKLVEINCVFTDPYGLVVLRERVPIVGGRGSGLKTGETKPFRLAFDSIPQSWNQAMPQLVIAQIVFE